MTASHCWQCAAMQLPGLCMEYKSVWIRTLADVGGERLSTQQMSAALIVGRVFGIRKSGITFKVVFVCFFGVCG